jgi:hypothetical protein
MGFNLAKCKCMKLGRCPIAYRYSLTDPEGNPYYLDEVQSERDLGVTVDNKLSFIEHIDTITKKANGILATIKRTFTDLDPTTFQLLYKALVPTPP